MAAAPPPSPPQPPQPQPQAEACPICLESLAGAAPGTTMRFPCPQRHRYHRECVGRYVPSAIEQRKCPVPCAMDGCTGAMADAQVGMFLSAAKMDDYLAILEAKRVAANPGLLPCPTPGCLGGLSKALVQAAKAAKAAAADEGEGEWDSEEEEQPVVCPKCGVGHVGLGDKTEADEELDRLAAGERYRRCPGCKLYIEPRGGCPKMTCVCGCKFCIDCGWVKDDGRGQTAPQVTCGCLRGKGHAFPDKPQSGRGDAPSEFEKGVAEVLRRVKAGEEVPRALRSSRSGGGRKRPRVEREEEEGGCGEG